ncbi:MAG: GH2 [uncultured Quadrisphaera sp.]|uniref:GH2 n=1 Tax=uncultured Quadrisphaera sp. TaxID=904978 RepID=A0A6J4Q3G8_9ACTN|nr:MAG: GH2 [uncultured Quadrisphaera sp.]
MTDTVLTAAAEAASEAEGTHPRPQLRRSAWADLGGTWEFAYDDDRSGGSSWLRAAGPFPRTITVPFPPESPASGVGDPGHHPVLWYRRTLGWDDLERAGWGSAGERVLLHFGAVDYRAEVWLDGHLLGRHEGGHTPFSFDVTDRLITGPAGGAQERAVIGAARGQRWTLLVRAEDDPLDVAQPRGKQDWQPEPHGIWYHRTSGIWQPVWLEVVPAVHVERVGWVPDVPSGTVALTVELSQRPADRVTVTVELAHRGEPLERVVLEQHEPRATTTITLARQRNGQAHEALLWSPEAPNLVDATITVQDPLGGTDAVVSYFGLRSVGVAGGHMMLNDRPYYVRAVLEQGYWPRTHLAAPGDDALRHEVEVTKALGFNTVRLHQKFEDPRYLYWADRLGLMVWSESASVYEFSPTAVERMTREWLDVVRRDASHPSIVTWVPLNESWGVQHIAHDPAQLDWARALYHLTKAVDPTRPVITNDGWEHADSDVWTVHDYATTGPALAAGYADRTAVRQMLDGIGPLGRRMRLLDLPDRGQPVIVSEFGGVSYAPSSAPTAWGYATAVEAEEFEALLRSLFTALQSSPVLAGFCYTQLTDTLQEANGLLDVERRPKLPVSTLRSIVLGEGVDTSAHRRPKRPVERVHPDAPLP